VEGLDVVPVLLQQRDQEVDGHQAVLTELIRGHADVADSDTHAQDLLELELDGGTDIRGLFLQHIGVRDHRRELTGLVQTRTQQTRNLRDQSLGGHEGVEATGELLNHLLVLVELLQILDGLEGHIELLGGVAVNGISEHADFHTRARHMLKADGTGETLISLGIVVLKTDLELHGLLELALLLLGLGDDGGDCLLEAVDVQLAHSVWL